MIDEAVVLNAAFDEAGGVKFHDRAAALAEFKQGREIVFDDEGQPYAHYDGENLKLSDALLRFAYDNRRPDLIDARTLPRSGAGTARPGTDHKGNYTTLADKAKYVHENGGDAWARLPVTGNNSNEVKTQQDWMRLPRAERVRRTAADPDAFVKLPSRPTGQSAGCYINHALIEKDRLTRPGGR